ncbi:hypothetical protein E2562_028039 [Oryza meyeriana var. granulata]|uniref:Uncharacterized protein n=1 Tax=Oryza meyeriana var. granulata TaxID=110450 RepID=A0A6G1BZ52_9ORYZ|nr:hypothetical protein E2562_028039 [Oryza meyeriana var. granulata]
MEALSRANLEGDLDEDGTDSACSSVILFLGADTEEGGSWWVSLLGVYGLVRQRRRHDFVMSPNQLHEF